MTEMTDYGRMGTPESPAASVISMSNISMGFGGREVLRSVDLAVESGEIHGLLGQNGSGKSTLIKILSGHHEPMLAPGQTTVPMVAVHGHPVDLPLTPRRAGALGLAFVHQELPVAATASVLENLRIGRFETAPGWRIRWRNERAHARHVLRSFKLNIDPDELVGRLDPVQRALVVILRALVGLPGDQPGLLVLDEPTAYLPRDGVEQLFAAIRNVASMGHGVLLVSHRLQEILAISERVSVIRDGAIVMCSATRELTEDDLTEAILGFQIGDLYPDHVEPGEEGLVSARGLAGDRLRECSFEVRKGEIIGLTGLIGAGYEEIPYLLFGATPASSGTVRLGDHAYAAGQLSCCEAMSQGVGLLPADRHVLSSIPEVSVKENVTLPTLRRYFLGGFLRAGAERERVQSILEAFDVRPVTPDRLLLTLSGGNQQKALLAKWFELRPRVMILHEPTQGVDVGARRHIFRLIHDAANDGVTIIVASSEFEDIANLCNRALVFRAGQLVTELAGADLTAERLVHQAMRSDPSPNQL